MSFDDKFIEQLKMRSDIVDVVSGYCNPEQKGGAYWACCPLPGHIEKTPSFCVNPVGQFYKCFGCGRGGDVIKFVMEVESLEFYEAVKFLADRVGMEVPKLSRKDEEENKIRKDKKERLLAILKASARFYVDNLRSDRAEEYRAYLDKRGISREVQIAFGIGASLDYKSLPEHLKNLGYDYEEMVEAGVVSYNREKNEYGDFEAKRLIIPIIDTFKNVIAFGGRVLEKTDFGKYKNTSQTSLFVKKNTLFNANNLSKAKRVKGKLDYVIMVEGYMDAISLYSAGFENVVASMGTSLTQMQAKMLKRYTDTVVISYDGDTAGQNATIRGLDILKDAGLTVKVISLPDGLDPDDVIRKRGKEAYSALIDEAMLLIDYKLAVLKNRYDVSTPQGKREFVQAAIKVIGQCEKSFEQEELLKQLSKMSGIAYEYLRRDLEKGVTEKENDLPEQFERRKKSSSGTVIAERFVLCAILNKRKYASPYDAEQYDFTDAVRKKTIEYALEKADNGEELFPSMLFDEVEESGVEELNLILLAGECIFGTETEEKYYKDCLLKLETESINADVAFLGEEYKKVQEIEARNKIAQLIQKKINRLKELRTEDKK